MTEHELNGYTKAELLAAAEQFGVEVKTNAAKNDIIAALELDGVNKALIEGFRPAEDDAPVEEVYDNGGILAPVVEAEAPADEEELFLVRMTRTNGTYQVRGYTFKRDHPFVLVKESDVDYLIDVEEGFRMATPKEAKEYYS